ncbi:MAG: MogA/MoaB family molybdenum cofactor biosynthesis protein [Bryobacteraceae bacterium]
MIPVAIVIISDSVVRGTREDRSGAQLRERVEALGWELAAQAVVADEVDQIAAKLTALVRAGDVSLILTTGGTGVALRDVTPEATRSVIDREIPGVAETMRSEGSKSTRYAVLSRGIAGTRGRVLIVNLPGSPKGALESLDAIADLIPHMVDLLHGKTEHAQTHENPVRN